MQRVNEKTIYFMQKNMKIHERKLKNFGQNNSELLSEYENLMFENKLLKDKQVKMKEEIKKMKG
jgi:FtsZ-binding cell division protein ZapB